MVQKDKKKIRISGSSLSKNGLYGDYCTYIGGISSARQTIGFGIDKITDTIENNFDLYWQRYEDDGTTTQEARKIIEEIDNIVIEINTFLDTERTQGKSLSDEELDKLEEYMRIIVSKIRD